MTRRDEGGRKVGSCICVQERGKTQRNLERDVVRGTEVVTDRMLKVSTILVQRLRMQSQRVVIPIMLTSYV